MHVIGSGYSKHTGIRDHEFESHLRFLYYKYHGLVLVTGGSNLTMPAAVAGTSPNIGDEATVSVKSIVYFYCFRA